MMAADDLVFVIPTHRLRDVADTIEHYDEHFRQHGHSVRMIVFDDSDPVTHEAYYHLLEQTRTHNVLYYVGPREKARLCAWFSERLGERRLHGVVRNLFKTSYGGNRNCTLMYTLGGLMVSADDDMRPYALMEDDPQSLRPGEICRGRLHPSGQNGYSRQSFDMLSSFLDVLGKPAGQVPDGYERGEVLVDTAMDLESNASRGLARENSLLLRRGPLPDDAVVRMAQTFLSGAHDIDALDYIEMFLEDEEMTHPGNLREVYVLAGFRPVVTKRNWRMSCGVAGYDNTSGLPPFFPTQLRFEDYSHRLWLQQAGVASAHVDAAQNHVRSNYRRHSPAAEILNEEVSNYLKRKIRSTLARLDTLGLSFEYEGEVTVPDAQEMLDRMIRLCGRSRHAAKTTAHPERAENLRRFAISLENAFSGFKVDVFRPHLMRIVRSVIGTIRDSVGLWPALIDICHVKNHCEGLPQVRVRNRRR